MDPKSGREVVSDSANRYTLSVFLVSRGVWTHHPHRLLHPQFFPSFATRRVGDDIHAAGTPPVPAPACPPGPARRSGSEFAPSPRAPVPRLVRATGGVPTLPAFRMFACNNTPSYIVRNIACYYKQTSGRIGVRALSFINDAMSPTIFIMLSFVPSGLCGRTSGYWPVLHDTLTHSVSIGVGRARPT